VKPEQVAEVLSKQWRVAGDSPMGRAMVVDQSRAFVAFVAEDEFAERIVHDHNERLALSAEVERVASTVADRKENPRQYEMMVDILWRHFAPCDRDQVQRAASAIMGVIP
jgi:hypothetical protein